MQAQERPWKTIGTVAGLGVVCGALVWAGIHWQSTFTSSTMPATFPLQETPFQGVERAAPTLHPFLELLKLVTAALIGMVVTTVHKYYHREKPLSRSLEQAQVLLCVAGAMVMIIVGNSFARALGLFGAGSIIRFRTPVEDPKDTTILFLLVGLGMSAGLGLFAVAGLGTIFLCVALFALDKIGKMKPRTMVLELVSEGAAFPAAHVHSVFARYGIPFERREVTQDEDEATAKYHVMLNPEISLDDLSTQFISGGASGIKSVVWGTPKKG